MSEAVVDVVGDGAAASSEVLTAAIAQLRELGFDARLRKVNLGDGRCVGVVAVEVANLDSRLAWSAGNRPAPCGFHYRRGERGPESVTLFSGWSHDELEHFVARLGALLFGLVDLQAFASARPHPEWNPHQLPEAERKRVNALLAELDRMPWPRPGAFAGRLPAQRSASVHFPAAKSASSPSLKVA